MWCYEGGLCTLSTWNSRNKILGLVRGLYTSSCVRYKFLLFELETRLFFSQKYLKTELDISTKPWSGHLSRLTRNNQTSLREKCFELSSAILRVSMILNRFKTNSTDHYFIKNLKVVKMQLIVPWRFSLSAFSLNFRSNTRKKLHSHFSIFNRSAVLSLLIFSILSNFRPVWVKLSKFQIIRIVENSFKKGVRSREIGLLTVAP